MGVFSAKVFGFLGSSSAFHVTNEFYLERQFSPCFSSNSSLFNCVLFAFSLLSPSQKGADNSSKNVADKTSTHRLHNTSDCLGLKDCK
jgi:hypothetical protein